MFGPSSFPGDDYGELTNQAGHILLGALIVAVQAAGHAVIAGATLRQAMFAGGAWWPGIALGVGFGLAWEGVQYLRLGAKGKDSRNDVAFYALGLAYPGPVWWPLLGCAVLAWHILRRRRAPRA